MIESIWFADNRIEVCEYFITTYKKDGYTDHEIKKKSIERLEYINELFEFADSMYCLKKLRLKSFFDTAIYNIKKFLTLVSSKDVKYFYLLKKNSNREYYRIIFKGKNFKPIDFWIYEDEYETFDNAFSNYYPDSVTKFWK